MSLLKSTWRDPLVGKLGSQVVVLASLGPVLGDMGWHSCRPK